MPPVVPERGKIMPLRSESLPDNLAGRRAVPPGPPESANPLDRHVRALVAELCGGLSPLALGLAWWDWSAHLALSPGRQLELAEHAGCEVARLWSEAVPSLEPTPPSERAREGDRRFADDAWMLWPYRPLAHSHLAAERWWEEICRDVHGARADSEALVSFAGRQLLDLWSPSNFLPTNPEAITRALNTKCQSLREGFRHWLEDLGVLGGEGKPAGTEAFVVGETVAVTPGKVVARTLLAEIIQYAPTTASVHEEPIVIVPAWIMKYYILDLCPENSLVKHLVDHGFTVFMVSWKNPTAADRDVTLDQYRTDGALAAIDAATAITGTSRVHAMGYCLGGTLLAITASAMARDGDERLKSLSLLATLTDFHEAGELRLFTNDSQLAFLEDMMSERGYLEGPRMMASFNLLRANDLIWSRMVREYMMGERRRMADVAAWSQDITRMPARMHGEYLRSLYLNNDLAEGRFMVDGHPVALRDISVPAFVLATERDHIAPWRSVYKIHLALDTDITFALTSGGHNQGVVSPSATPGRHYRVGCALHGAHYVDPNAWLDGHPLHEGSWWAEWLQWLKSNSSGRRREAHEAGGSGEVYRPLCDAPGTYVRD